MQQTALSVLNSILLVGSGRLAKHLIYWNNLNKQPSPLLVWDRSQSEDDLHRMLKQVNHVWLAVSDSSIVPFFEKHLHHSNILITHFSGALYDKRIKSAHPLMSFPHQLLEPEIYQKIGFAITGAQSLESLMPGFKNTFFKVEAKNKALYHALCVVAGNFPQLLWAEASDHFQALNVPEESYHLYLSQILQNFLTLRQKALTGPLVRNDQQTLEKNEFSLAGTKLHSIFRSFRKEFSQ